MSKEDLSINDEKVFEVLNNDQLSPESHLQSQSVCIVPKPGKVSTPVSILIESLVKNVCTMLESDQNKASMMYKLICDKLFTMNLIDESYNMTEFEGMRSQYMKAFLQLVSSVKSGDKNLPLRPIWPTTEINSHYLREFEEIEYIAGGGFGQVYRVKHKLDGAEYAVKSIAIRSEGIESVRNYLSEVKTFASMNHPNIVQYKAAWLEIGPPANTVMVENKTEDTTVSENTSECDSKHTNNYVYHKNCTESFTNENYEDSTDFEIDFEHSVSGANSRKPCRTYNKLLNRRHSVSEGGKSVFKLDIKEIEKLKIYNKTRIKWATLYIQMALCHSTLKQWLERRNAISDPRKAVVHINDQVIRFNTINQILIQLLKGLEYIHSKGIVHHDIKPSNIFIQIENKSILIQLGDFGLACPLQNVHHSLAFGTKLYAAPEQLAGKCNPKSDIYSVGIVLFELVENFSTDMERVKQITELRKGHISSKLLINHPEFAKLIGKLTIKNPDDRPDTTTLLNTLRSTESEQIEQLKVQLAEKDEEILHLKELLRSHGIKSV
ncbi:hypothetical protein NQ317_015872 [Molorchus minor]|uniref:non-specific serine/threonine protein kinase n=1 Tax=Molorchus minor TaxID=1323400 RepID=A0ABQ9JKP8_9CUCU|nr:hypothetical protein NQ317_015872 [Molorchus minor]